MNKAVPSLVYSMIPDISLQEWHDMTREMYPNEIELLALIPNSADMSPTKLIGGFLSHDNCATANKTCNNVMDMILKLGK